MRHVAFTVLLGLTISVVAHAAEPLRGSIFIEGNELKAPQLVLRADSIFADDMLSWPYGADSTVARSSARTSVSTTVSPRMVVRATLDSLCSLGIHPTATDVAELYRRLGNIVDGTTIDPISGNVWVSWHAGFTEEVTPECPTNPESQTEPPTQAILEVWEHVLATGGRIYVGKNYSPLLVPAPLVEFFNQGFHGTVTSPSARQVFKTRYAAVAYDLNHPAHLSNIPRR